jgi:hypothetical protein
LPVIKQFNFYDIYGYLLPGILILGLFWLPVGVLTQKWPDQDISKALFLAALAYIVGHIVQMVSSSAIPSTVRDHAKKARYPSDLLLDKSNLKFPADFKDRLSKQVKKLYGLDLNVKEDGNGKNDLSKSRQTAFFQARSFLILKKAANYVEQFEGLYAMMRGLGCSFFASAAYFVGWGLSFHYGSSCQSRWGAVALCAALAIPLIPALVSFLHKPARKIADRILAFSWLLALGDFGFLAGSLGFQSQRSSTPWPSCAEAILWGAALLSILAGLRCISAYYSFAEMFAITVWRDFSALISFQESPPQLSGDTHPES